MSLSVDFIVDCGPTVGMGHLSRSKTLAHALQARGAEVRLFATDARDVRPDDTLRLEGLADAPAMSGDIVIVDGLLFSSEEVMRWRPADGLFVVLDDLGDRPVSCDVLVNQNIYGDRLAYDGYDFTAALLGPEWALIKPEFADARAGASRKHPRALLTFGGGVTGAIAVETARLMASRFSGPIDVALGALSGVEAVNLPANVTIYRDADMPTLMARATLYVGSLGVTFLEALAAALPAIAVCVVDNQRIALDAARDLGVRVFETPDPPAIADIAVEALVAPTPLVLAQPDGRGAARTADALLAALSRHRQKR